MYQSVSEPIEAYVIYKPDRAEPVLHAFRWRDRRYQITSINLIHSEQSGRTRFVCYSVSCGCNSFRIRLDTERLRWMLDAIEV